MSLTEKAAGFNCVECGREFALEPFRYTCDSCGGNLDVEYNYAFIRERFSQAKLKADAEHSIWRYLPLLPVNEPPPDSSILVGGTPLVRVQKYERRYNLRGFFLKDDSRNPSLSLKDRATEVGLRHAAERSEEVVVAASTGNAAASLAALGAYYRCRVVIIAPRSAPVAKLVQILQHGAELCLVDGTYDDAFDLSLEITRELGWYSRNTGFNPVLSEGKKTAALEIAEQLDWNPPDVLFVPVGDGCIIGGVYKGFYDLLQLDWIEKIPRLVAVQAEGSAAIVSAIASGGEVKRVLATTVADSISVAFPRDATKAVRAVKESGGSGVVISDSDILNAQKQLSEETGIFAEPAAAAAFGGFIKATKEGLIEAGETVGVLITGSGLKDIAAAQGMITLPDPIKPDIRTFMSFID